MRSSKQIEASRLNGAKSHGPVTEEGKRNSARSNWQRGLLARTVVLESESRDRFTRLYDSLVEEIQPNTTIETLLVQKMAVAQWRQMRLWGIEKSDPAEGPSIWEARFDRQFDRALGTFERLRHLKKSVEPGK
jgi:hypothetical protein